MANKIITAYITKFGLPQTGLTPSIKIYEITSTVDTVEVNSDALTEVGDGLYKYVFTNYDNRKNYSFIIDADSSFPPGERYYVSVNESYVEDISSEVWEEDASQHDNPGTMGEKQNDISEALTIVSEIIKYDRNRTKIDEIEKTLTVFDDDGVTPYKVFDLKDDNGVASIQDIFERIPQ